MSHKYPGSRGEVAKRAMLANVMFQKARTPEPARTRSNPARLSSLRLLGPAFVAAVAYIDPGNVASNLSAGAQYSYLLVWVIVTANLMAALIQYLSATLGFAARASLTELLGRRVGRIPRLLYWAQAELVAVATDLAEIVGGAVALRILFDLPLLTGGIIVGLASLALLWLSQGHGGRRLEQLLIGFLVIIAAGFCAGLVVGGFDVPAMMNGLLPRFADTNSVALAAAMLGATVMPHAIYLHSALTRDVSLRPTPPSPHEFTRATRIDVVLALAIAGAVNLALLLLAAAHLREPGDTDAIEDAARAISDSLGPAVGIAFGIALLASGLASTSVGAYAGSEIMASLLRIRIPLLARRAITIIPALVLLALPFPPTEVLVVSQIVLSLGIPFALIPLVYYTARQDVMGSLHIGPFIRVAAIVCAVAIVALNVALVVLVLTGQSLG